MSSFSFVRDMRVNKENELIVHSTIQLAHNLGLNVIAEGVEDEATLTQLQAFGCDEAQGYFISRPLEAEQATAWLAARQAV
jgi:EAL domain-containing protein (putative c-di-GMP-specific phosphodiesterase class I)